MLGSDDPVKLNPRFQTSPDRRHELYKKHESALRSMETSQVKELLKKIKNLEKQKLEEVDLLLQNGINDSSAVALLFSKCVEEEMKIYE